MDYDIKALKKDIQKTHQFGFTPKYENTFHTQLSNNSFIPIAIQTLETLDWHLIYQDDTTLEAKIGVKNWGFKSYDYREIIKIKFEFGNVSVYSESLKAIIWDNGRNSKRVELFIKLFQLIEQSYDQEAKKALELAQEKTKNWADYEIPTSLPDQPPYKQPKLLLPIIGMFITCIIIGFILAILSLKGIYIVFLFESIIAILLTLILKLLIKWSNVTNFNHLSNILYGSIFLLFLSNEIFQYLIFIKTNYVENVSFLQYISFKLESGLKLKTSNIGAWGYIILWIVQLGLTGIIGYLRLGGIVCKYAFEKIPPEVFNYAAYLFVKGKDEAEVRACLSKLGWDNEDKQTEVFDAISAYNTSLDIDRFT